ncbi:MAG: rod shape-determining protein RodA [Chlorobium sp.]|nr:MAG: rod shape-determining protein RodA [Chlorobium sp.]
MENRINSNSNIDFWLLIPMLGIIVFGLMAIYSATNGTGETGLFFRQLTWALIGVALVGFIIFNDIRFIRDNSYIFYAIGVILLIGVLIVGKKVGGHASWFRIGFFSFQPSEIVKHATILALGKFLSDDETKIDSIKNLMIALAIPMVPALLIALQGDMGTTITCMSFVIPMIIVAGFDIYILMLISFPLLTLISGFFGINFIIFISLLGFIALVIWKKGFKIHQVFIMTSGLIAGFFTNKYAGKILLPHQMKRIQIFLDPMSDPQGAGYNVLQAKIAITSGGLFGKGFLHGTQTQLRFIPAQWTDFIFCVIAEEFGFILTALLIIFYLALILRLAGAVAVIKNKFVELTLTGFISLLFTHVVVNIGMTIGLFPVIGVPLPFVSYGGSSLLGNMIMVGLAMNFYRNKRLLGY